MELLRILASVLKTTASAPSLIAILNTFRHLSNGRHANFVHKKAPFKVAHITRV